jgi:solute carrier family 25 folate transporter 32
MSALDASRRVPPWIHGIAGTLAGVISVAALHPLDLLKVRFMVQQHHVAAGTQGGHGLYPGLRAAVVSIWRAEGARGFYHGATAHVLASGSAWGLYLLLYARLSQARSGADRRELNPGEYLLVGFSAGALTQLFTNPLWILKTRMEIGGGSRRGTYPGVAAGLRALVREGPRGLVRGMLPALLGVPHGAIQFMFYEEIRKAWNAARLAAGVTEPMSSLHFSTMAVVSKVFTSVLLYPQQVVKAVIQDRDSPYKTFSEAVSHTWRIGGLRAFYAGIVPGVLRVLPASAITFVAFENIAGALALMAGVDAKADNSGPIADGVDDED